MMRQNSFLGGLTVKYGLTNAASIFKMHIGNLDGAELSKRGETL